MQTAFHVAQTDIEVLANAGFGDAAGDGQVKEVGSRDVVGGATDENLIRGGHVFGEGFGSDGGEGWVGSCSYSPT